MDLADALTPRVPMLMAGSSHCCLAAGPGGAATPPRHKRYGMARRGHLPPRTPVAFALPISIGHSGDVNQMFGHDNKYPLHRECRRRKITHLAKCRRRSFSLPRAAGLPPSIHPRLDPRISQTIHHSHLTFVCRSNAESYLRVANKTVFSN